MPRHEWFADLWQKPCIVCGSTACYGRFWEGWCPDYEYRRTHFLTTTPYRLS